MRGKKIKYLLIFSILATVGFIVYDSTTLPSAKDLDGNFREVALYRNANNTGPIVRIYAVTVQGKPWEEMQKYGDLMPYTKYGSTTVYFFGEGKPFPNALSPGTPNFDSVYNQNVLARYVKDANGQVSFTKGQLD
jgi:hypothetical protein